MQVSHKSSRNYFEQYYNKTINHWIELSYDLKNYTDLGGCHPLPQSSISILNSLNYTLPYSIIISAPTRQYIIEIHFILPDGIGGGIAVGI